MTINVTFARLTLYFLRLGATGFGGPIALAGHMQKALVEERGWITREEYLDGLALAQLAPGPLAAQLAVYIGYIRYGVLGATAVAIAFVLPSFLMVWAISVAYVAYGGLPAMQALFYGVGAVVIGIIGRSAWKLARLTVGNQPVLWAMFLVLAVITAWTEREIVWLFLIAGGLYAALVRRAAAAATASAAFLLPATPAAAVGNSVLQILWFFTKAGAFIFGSGLAIVPFLYGGVVQEFRWLNDREFLDAVAVAMITPGPVVITVAFIGYLVRGVWGMIAASVGVFLPMYLFVVLLAPSFHRYKNNPTVKAFVTGITAATAGAIAGAAVVLARRAVIDLPTAAIALASLVVLFRWKISELWLIGVAAALGLWLRA